MAEQRQTVEEVALEVRRLTEQLVRAGRKDLILKAIGVPMLEELRIEAARGKLSRLVITEDYRFVLADYNNTEVELQPVHKAVYLLFLNHPEGIEFKRLTEYREELLNIYMKTARWMDKEKIVFKCLPDYREELIDIYKDLRPLGLNNRSLQSIEDVTNPCLNSINEKCARIRAAFINKFDEHLAKNYFVTGERGEAKKITLSRDLVVWE